METKALVVFKKLANENTVVALAQYHGMLIVDVAAVETYMKNMCGMTGGTDVEFNNTFRQICKDRVFYAFNRIEQPYMEFKDAPFVPEIVECVLLSDDRVAMNLNGNVCIMVPEDGDTIYRTKEAAQKAAEAHALEEANNVLDKLCETRRETKKQLQDLSSEIDKHLAFKRTFLN